MNKILRLFSGIALILLVSCNTGKFPREGVWRGVLQLGDKNNSVELPFNFEINGSSEESISLLIYNAEEKIEIKSFRFTDDSIFFYMPVFDSEFRLEYSSNKLEGKWYNYANGPDSYMEFVAVHGIKERFFSKEEANNNISGRWEVIFGPESRNPSIAIGEFKQDGNYLTGTFMTETGDYRFLEGIVSGNKMMLSCFDGAHSFLFTANVPEQGLMEGSFRSGKRGGISWKAIKNNNATIGDPYSLTYLKEGYDNIEFSFPDRDNNLVSLNDEEYKDKLVILQILGTWCPNCMDETLFLADIYKKYNNRGLEIIGLAYEKAIENEKVWRNIDRLKDFSGAEYIFLHAGNSNKREAAKTLPMLNHVLSYPTTIFIDKKGEIRKIFTGFTGPGTGETFEKLSSEIIDLIEKLLAE